MKITILGSGYVGLVAGICLANIGHSVIVFDTDRKRINLLNHHKLPIFEPGLLNVLIKTNKSRSLKFTDNPKIAISKSNVFFITVGTPFVNHKPELNNVYKAAKIIGDHIELSKSLIILKSTSVVGTTRKVKRIILNRLRTRHKNIEICVVSSPEFLREGSAISDFQKPDRLVIGIDGQCLWAINKLKRIYAPYINHNIRLIITDTISSELSKYAANSMLALRISFINEIANICDCIGANIDDIKKIITADKRIGKYYLNPGIGFGGSCLPKDIKTLSYIARQYHYNSTLMNIIDKINNRQPNFLIQKLTMLVPRITNQKIAIWGGSFKPNTNDVRFAPSIKIIRNLLAKKVEITVYDPKAMEDLKKLFGHKIKYSSDMYECIKGANVLLILTEWKEFKKPKYKYMKKLMSGRLIIDGRNIYSPDIMKHYGFRYVSVGRKST